MVVVDRRSLIEFAYRRVHTTSRSGAAASVAYLLSQSGEYIDKMTHILFTQTVVQFESHRRVYGEYS
jgi:hypothetical protein